MFLDHNFGLVFKLDCGAGAVPTWKYTVNVINKMYLLMLF